MSKAFVLSLALLASSASAAKRVVWKKEEVETIPFQRGDPSKQPVRKHVAANSTVVGFCSEVASDLPPFCDCADTTYGGLISCDVDIVGLFC